MLGLNNQMDGVTIKEDRRDQERSRFGEGEIKSLVLGMLIWKVPIPSPSAESERELDI